MVAWTGIEHFRVGRFDPPPPANELEDARVRLFSSSYYFFPPFHLECLLMGIICNNRMSIGSVTLCKTCPK